MFNKKEQLWRAPELHFWIHNQVTNSTLNGTQKGDVYSFAIIIQEIFYRKGVFYLDDKDKLMTYDDETKENEEKTISFKGLQNCIAYKNGLFY